eukprot:753108-Hanusia_phi.AAC.3
MSLNITEEGLRQDRIGLEGLGDSGEKIWLKAGRKAGRGVSKTIRASIREPQKDRLKFEFRAIKDFEVPDVPLCIHQSVGLVSIQLVEKRTRHGRPDYDSSIFRAVMEKIQQETRCGFSRIGSLSLAFSSCPATFPLPIVPELVHCSPSISELSLIHVPMGNSGMEMLSAGLGERGLLRSLTLHTIGIDEGAVHSLGKLIGVNSNLRQLSLQDLTLSFNGSKLIGQALHNNTALTSLSLRNAQLGPLGMGIFSQCLANKSCLQELDLCGNNMQNFGLQQALSEMSQLRSLRCLDLSQNSLDGYFILNMKEVIDRQHGLESLKIAGMHRMDICLPTLFNLAMITQLTELDLSDISRGSQFLTLFTVGLASLKHLVWLGLSNLGLKADEVLVLSGSLKSSESLEHLSLSSNFIGQQGMIALANSDFARLSRLRELDLADNDLGPVGAIGLCCFLGSFNQLTSLDLSDNQMGAVGGQHLISALPRHLTALTSLSLDRNMLGDRGAELLVEVLVIMRHVEYVRLSGNSISEDFIDYIREVCDGLEICIEMNM